MKLKVHGVEEIRTGTAGIHVQVIDQKDLDAGYKEHWAINCFMMDQRREDWKEFLICEANISETEFEDLYTKLFKLQEHFNGKN